MNARVQAIPEDLHTLTPHLVCAKPLEAIKFYKRAFGATDERVMLTPDSKMMHGMVRIGDSALMLLEENPEWGALGPTMLGGSPVTMHLYVNNCDDVFNKAVAEGATANMPPADMFWGDHYGVLTDPFGHSWSIETYLRDVSPEEMQAAVGSMGGCSDAMGQS